MLRFTELPNSHLIRVFCGCLLFKHGCTFSGAGSTRYNEQRDFQAWHLEYVFDKNSPINKKSETLEDLSATIGYVL